MKKIRLLLVELSILALSFVSVCFSMYFFVNQFNAADSLQYPDSGERTVISNYLSFPINDNMFTKTTQISGYVLVDDQTVETVMAAQVTVGVGSCFNAGDTLGTSFDGSNIVASCCGCMLDLNEQDGKSILMTYINYQHINFEFSLDNTYHNKLDYNTMYICNVGGVSVPVNLYSITVDINSNQFDCIFRIADDVIVNDFLPYNAENCQLILEQNTYSMMNVRKDILQYYQLEVGGSYKMTVRYPDGHFDTITINIVLIGDEYIGIQTDDDLKDASICVEKLYD